MPGRVIHISSPCHLHRRYGALEVARKEEKSVILPIEDLSCLVLDGEGITLSAGALSLCSEFKVAVIVSDEKHMPSGLLLPLGGHATHAEVLRGQVESSLPKRKRVWQQIVQAKIRAQSGLLAHLGRPDPFLDKLAERVGSGDPQNMEGRAASRYWERLFGEDFTRERGVEGENSLLNYGYAILRSLTARAIVGAGLHPALGVFHGNRYNPYALADDAMEPLRPLVDLFAWTIVQREGPPEVLTPALKQKLLQLTLLTVRFEGNQAHIQDGLERMATSLRRALCEEGRRVELPLPIWSAAIELCGLW